MMMCFYQVYVFLNVVAAGMICLCMQVNDKSVQDYIEYILDYLEFDRNGYWIGAHDQNNEGNFQWESG